MRKEWTLEAVEIRLGFWINHNQFHWSLRKLRVPFNGSSHKIIRYSSKKILSTIYVSGIVLGVGVGDTAVDKGDRFLSWTTGAISIGRAVPRNRKS